MQARCAFGYGINGTPHPARKRMQLLKALLASSVMLFISQTQADTARDYVSVVGSSTVYPFSTVVAEQLGRAGNYRTPKIEATGTGGGIKLFCSGIGVHYPDIVNASRTMKPSELQGCVRTGVKEIVEVKIGFDGIILAHSKDATGFDLDRKEIFLALAKNVPDPASPESGKLVVNPYKTWKQINPAFPDVKIEVLGPPPTSGTRDSFVELAMEVGCQGFNWINVLKKKDESRFRTVCHTVREDGAFIEAGENDNLIAQKLIANSRALGIFGFSFLEQNTDQISAVRVDGVVPEFETIASRTYPISRPLYFYVKKAHVGVIPGLDAYIAEFTSEKAVGDEGYLIDKGLVPLPLAERKTVAADAKKLKILVIQ